MHTEFIETTKVAEKIIDYRGTATEDREYLLRVLSRALEKIYGQKMKMGDALRILEFEQESQRINVSNLRAWRTEIGLTGEEGAALLDKSRTWLVKLEKGTFADVDMRTGQALAYFMSRRKAGETYIVWLPWKGAEFDAIIEELTSLGYRKEHGSQMSVIYDDDMRVLSVVETVVRAARKVGAKFKPFKVKTPDGVWADVPTEYAANLPASGGTIRFSGNGPAIPTSIYYLGGLLRNHELAKIKQELQSTKHIHFVEEKEIVYQYIDEKLGKPYTTSARTPSLMFASKEEAAQALTHIAQSSVRHLVETAAIKVSEDTYEGIARRHAMAWGHKYDEIVRVL